MGKDRNGDADSRPMLPDCRLFMPMEYFLRWFAGAASATSTPGSPMTILLQPSEKGMPPEGGIPVALQGSAGAAAAGQPAFGRDCMRSFILPRNDSIRSSRCFTASRTTVFCVGVKVA